ncbi:MAG TPA: inorganic pyrophosphatase [Bacteroidia bacterium]|nr:inorganic pyrophosphatase [Bacteroidia bacterium]
MIDKKKYSSHKAHPWHGISPGEHVPQIVTAFIEIVPGDTVKYEIDKETGFLKIDRPQLFSNVPPVLYGFIPQTYCGDSIAEYCARQSGEKVRAGDGDPLDICVLSERTITHGNILLQAIPIGGLRMIDKQEADDKLIAVLKDDPAYGEFTDVSELPEKLVNRLRHYFLTYKAIPGEQKQTVSIASVYGREEAHEVIRRSLADYKTFCAADT